MTLKRALGVALTAAGGALTGAEALAIRPWTGGVVLGVLTAVLGALLWLGEEEGEPHG